MGSKNLTHHDGQVLTECPECEQTIRLSPKASNVTPVMCGNDGVWFYADGNTGDVVKRIDL